MILITVSFIMPTNPFVISSIIPPQFFCDRERETERIVRLLLNGNNLVLISPRRLGKSGLIHHCFQLPQIKDTFTTIFVDILQTTSLREFTFLLGKAVYGALMPKGKRFVSNFIDTLKSLTGKFSYDPVSGAPSFSIQIGDISRPEFTLEEIFQFLENYNSKCIVAIDEFQQITDYPEKNVEAVLRTYIQQLSNCNFIFAGSKQHIINEMFISHARPFYLSSSIMHLDPIPEDVYVAFVERIFKEHNKNVVSETIREVYHKFEGNTFYMQSVFNEAYAITNPGHTCDTETVELALSDIINFNAGTYRELLSGISLRQKELLLSILKNEPAEAITSSAFIKANSLFSASSVQAAARKLSDLNILVKNANAYYISDRFFALWLKEVY